MIYALIGAALFILSVPFLALLFPALWAYRATAIGGYGDPAPFGAFVLTLNYSIVVWTQVHNLWLLFLLVVAVPWLLGRVLIAGGPHR